MIVINHRSSRNAPENHLAYLLSSQQCFPPTCDDCSTHPSLPKGVRHHALPILVEDNHRVHVVDGVKVLPGPTDLRQTLMRRMPRVQTGSLPAADEAFGGNRLELIIHGCDRGLVDLALGFGELEEFVSDICQLQRDENMSMYITHAADMIVSVVNTEDTELSQHRRRECRALPRDRQPGQTTIASNSELVIDGPQVMPKRLITVVPTVATEAEAIELN